jgi:hypothetical protein
MKVKNFDERLNQNYQKKVQRDGFLKIKKNFYKKNIQKLLIFPV